MTFGQDSSSNLYFHQEIHNIWLSDGSSIDGYGLVLSIQWGAEYINILSLFFHLFYKKKLLINYLVTLRYSSFGEKHDNASEQPHSKPHYSEEKTEANYWGSRVINQAVHLEVCACNHYAIIPLLRPGNK